MLLRSCSTSSVYQIGGGLLAGSQTERFSGALCQIYAQRSMEPHLVTLFSSAETIQVLSFTDA